MPRYGPSQLTQLLLPSVGAQKTIPLKYVFWNPECLYIKSDQKNLKNQICHTDLRLKMPFSALSHCVPNRLIYKLLFLHWTPSTPLKIVCHGSMPASPIFLSSMKKGSPSTQTLLLTMYALCCDTLIHGRFSSVNLHGVKGTALPPSTPTPHNPNLYCSLLTTIPFILQAHE